MLKLTGAHNEAICYLNELEDTAKEQIQTLCDQESYADTKIRIMPDAHAGKGCTIGTTMTITDRVCPGMVGVDIGCGMETVRLRESSIDFEKLDEVVKKEVPCGREIRTTPHPFSDEIDLKKLRIADSLLLSRAVLSVGTLGGGNHFIEIDRGEEGELYLIIHSGSRHIGSEVAEYYQKAGEDELWGRFNEVMQEQIALLKSENRFRDIESTVKKMKKESHSHMPKELSFVEGPLFEDYIHDMKIIQEFALLNRKAMADVILSGMGLTADDSFSTIHNYIDLDTMILRKGSVSAKKGETLLIPMNMRDGSLICVGEGNADWNESAPHGAGRLMSRRAAERTFSMSEYQSEMAGIYTSCVNPSTLDESPMAYKKMDSIVSQIEPTAKIVAHIKPVYNFKATE